MNHNHAQRAIRDETGKVIGFEPFSKERLKEVCKEAKAKVKEQTNQILTDSNAALHGQYSEPIINYLKRNKAMREFRLVVDDSGKGYIHALGQDSETLDFQL